MASTTERIPHPLSRFVPAAAVGVLLAGALVVWLRFGAPAVVLWFAFSALAGAILLFWESLRTALDPNAAGDEESVEIEDRWRVALENRKRVAVQALRDVEFEHSIHRMSDEDHAALTERYRGEARAAMEALDKGLGAYLATAEEMISKALDDARDESQPRNRRKASSAPAVPDEKAVGAEVAPDTDDGADVRECPSCETPNDADAVFCKKCGTRIE